MTNDGLLLVLCNAHVANSRGRKMFIGGLNWETTDRKHYALAKP